MIWFWLILLSLVLLSTWLIAAELSRDLNSTMRNWPNTIEEEDK